MDGSERRRSARHLLGVVAEVHVGTQTVQGVVQDVSAHGMGLVLPRDVVIAKGDTIWVIAESVAPFAITATVQRLAGDGVVGVEFHEVLSGESLNHIEALPLPMPDEPDA